MGAVLARFGASNAQQPPTTVHALTLDTLPTEILARIIELLDKADRKPRNTLALGRTSSTFVDLTRRQLVSSILWPRSESGRRSLQQFTVTHPQYIALVRRLVAKEDERDHKGRRRADLDANDLVAFMAELPRLQHLKLVILPENASWLEIALCEISAPADLATLEVELLCHDLDAESAVFHLAAVDLLFSLLVQSAETLRRLQIASFCAPPFGVHPPILPSLRTLSVTSCARPLSSSLVMAAARPDLTVRCGDVHDLHGTEAAGRIYDIGPNADSWQCWQTKDLAPYTGLRRLLGIELGEEATMDPIDLSLLSKDLEILDVILARTRGFTAIHDQLEDRAVLPNLRMLRVQYLMAEIDSQDHEMLYGNQPWVDEALASLGRICGKRGIFFVHRVFPVPQLGDTDWYSSGEDEEEDGTPQQQVGA